MLSDRRWFASVRRMSSRICGCVLVWLVKSGTVAGWVTRRAPFSVEGHRLAGLPRRLIDPVDDGDARVRVRLEYGHARQQDEPLRDEVPERVLDDRREELRE